MKRMTEAWFRFNGVRSDALGLRLVRMPERRGARRAGESVRLPGRDGALWLDGGAYEPWRMEIECETTADWNERAARLLLLGPGELVLSDEPERALRVRIAQGIRTAQEEAAYDRKRVWIEAECQPYRYFLPEAEAIELTEEGWIENPGTAPSLPRIEVQAAGEWTLLIGGQLIESADGSVIIDSELRDCLSADGALLANDRVTLGEFPVLQSGANAVQWSGGIEKLVIRPRWRDL